MENEFHIVLPTNFLDILSKMASTSVKIYATIMSIVVFIIVSLPFTYKLTNSLLGGIIGRLADASGCPTTLGLLIHSVVFGLIIYSLM
jgi:hypothetical protein